MKDKVLFLFTAKFPFGKGEEFLEKELFTLSKHFEKIYIVPVFSNAKNLTKKVPENSVIINTLILNKIYKQFNKNNLYKRFIALINFKLLFNELKFALKYTKIRYLFKLYDSISFRIYYAHIIYKYTKNFINTIIQQNIEQSIFLNNNENNNNNFYFYTYWFNYSVLSFYFFKKFLKKRFNSSFVSNLFIARMHGYDLYSFRRPFNYQEFQYFNIKMIVDKAFVNSKYGINHLLDYYKNENVNLLKNKLELQYLGINTEKYKIIKDLKPISKNVLKFITCSYIVPVKRMEIIINFFKKLKLPFIWYHIGDGYGNYKEMVLEKANSLNYDSELKKFIFKGYMRNEEVLSFYYENDIDFILNFSSSEGVPVSLMEAMLFGIVPLAVSVGGIPEIIINKTNGFLLNPDSPINDAIEAVNFFMKLSAEHKLTMRKNAIKTIKENFDANKNYNEFADKIKRV